MEPLVHLTIPFAALMLMDIKVTKALIISLFALLPDLDAFFLVHRSFSHSMVVMLIVIAPFLLFVHKLKPKLQTFVFLALIAMVSHPVLDLFAGYTPILWPLCSYSVWIPLEIRAHVGSSLSLIPDAQLLTEPTTFYQVQSLDAPLFTGEGLVLSAVLLMPVLLKVFNAWRRKAMLSKG